MVNNNLLNELVNGNYYYYDLEDGGAGIVMANGWNEAKRKVKEAYTKHSSDPFTENIMIYPINQKPFDDAPDVLEIYEY